MRGVVFLIGIILLITAQVTTATFLTFHVDPRKSRCFFEEINAGDTFSMYFEVIRGGLLDIKFQLTDPNRNIVIDRISFFNKPEEEANTKEGTVLYNAVTSGTYKICFDNNSSRWTAKVVSFEIRSARANKQEAAKLEHLGPMVDSVINLSNTLDDLEKTQRGNRIREKQYYVSVKELNSRVQWMIGITSVVLFALTILSIHNIQKWFDTDSRRSGV